MPLFFSGRRWLLPGCSLFVAASLFAQDVTVGDLRWFSPEPPPDALPKPKGSLRAAYPDALRKSDEIGYVVIVRSVDENGKKVWLSATGSHAPLQRAVEDQFPEWSLPAPRREGAPVYGRFWIPIIFNPKSAAVKGAEARPRLLAVAPVITPTKPGGGDAPTVRMKLMLDDTGAVTHAEPEEKVSPKNLEAIRAALQEWRFAPARQNGRPVAAELVMPVVCQTAPKTDTREGKPARVLEKVTPDYPLAMRRYGLSGEVKIAFDVDEQGRVRNPVIVESDNPGFDEAALRALLQWKFAPATRDGAPVASRHLPVAIKFNRTGDDAYRLRREPDQSKLPPHLRYDTPPSFRGVLVPVYPYSLRRDGVRGKARAAVMIDARGRVEGVKVLAADRPEFGRALAAALEGFRFDPAYNNGKPVPHAFVFEQTFGPFELPDPAGEDVLALEKKHPERIVEVAALDAAPKPVSQRPPVIPTALKAGAAHAEALIECVIDTEGRVRLPRVITSTDEAFGYAAAQAASAWWFEPPTVAGKKVNVRCQIPFKLGRDAAP